MPPVSIAFSFDQRFPFAAAEVYAWATNYDPADIERMGLRGRRRIRRLNDDTIILTDRFEAPDGTGVSKRKLVRLFPERLTWTNTHVAGPNRHSQFLYVLVPEGADACRLEFTGRQILQLEGATRRDVAAHARRLRKEDAAIWKNLARALRRDRRGR
jgi:hypothetical protein